MAKLAFNDELIEGKQGETLLQAARRHGAYVWFMCDGRGICQTCECRVVSGAENLGELSELERIGLGRGLRRKGYRLACQARLLGAGSVSVISRAEELRRRGQEVLSGGTQRSLWQRVQTLGGESMSAMLDLSRGVASASPRAIPQLLNSPPTPARILDYVRDTVRVAGRLWALVASAPDRSQS